MTAPAATVVLVEAARAYTAGGKRPLPSSVVTALLQIEREQKRNKVRSDLSLLHGQWRLVFTTDDKSKFPPFRALYFPIRAHQTFFHGGEKGDIFDNAVFLGRALSMRLSGAYRWEAAMNRLVFTVSKIVLKLGGLGWEKDGLDKEDATLKGGASALEGRTAKTLPFFTFFLIRSDILAARGRSGGLALYARVPNGEEW